MAQISEYTKTGARWQGFLRGGSVWLASDHVLSVSSSRFLEEYKRFYYRDIQALMVRNGPRWWCPGWVWFGAPVIAIASLILYAGLHVALAGIGLASLIALVCLVLYQSIERGCYCYVVTAVSANELVGVRTQKAARQVKTALIERIMPIQGPMPESWQEHLQTENSAPAPPEFRWFTKLDEVAPAPALGIWMAALAIVCTVVDAALSFAQLRQASPPEGLGLINVVVGVAAAVTALVLLRGRDPYNWLRHAALLCVMMMGAATYLAYLANRVGSVIPALSIRLRAIQQGIGVFNVAGDLLMVCVAAGLWVRHRNRPGAQVNRPVASVGDL